MIVRCNECMRTFDEDDIVVIDDVEYCPICGKSGCLMDMEVETDVV